MKNENCFNLFDKKNELLLVQSNKLIMSKYSLTMLEQKLIRILISLVDKDDEEFKEYNLYVKDLQKLLNLKNLYAELPLITENLLKKIIVIQEGKNILQTTWFSSAYYKTGEGVVSIQFATRLKPYLLELKSEFTKYKLENILYLKSCYSIRIYELLKQYSLIQKREITISDLKETLGITKEYPKYANFKARVLVKVQEDLKNNSDIFFDFEEVKRGREVVAIVFLIYQSKGINKKQIEKNDFTIDDKSISNINENNENTLITYLQSNIDENISIKSLQKMLKRSNNNTQKILSAYKYAKNNKKIDNLVAFLIWASGEDVELEEPIEFKKGINKNRFNNFEGREWDFEKIEKLATKKLMGAIT